MKKMIKYSVVLLSAVLALTGTVPFSAAAAESDSPVADMTAFYQNWKNRYVRQDPYTADETRYYVYYSEDTYTGGDPVPVTVSEAHGYGMLITVSMADYDSEAKDLFDGMVRYYLAHPSEIGPHLMAWQQSDNGSTLTETDGADSATDGDMDIAYALLLADKVWGSSGSLNYRAMGEAVLEDIMTYEVNQTTWTLSLGDWTYGESGSKYDGATRASDFILQYLPVFAAVTGDDRWTKVYDSTNAIITDMVDTYGKDSVAQITTFGTMKAKGVVRDVGRALGMSFAETDRIAKLVPDDLKMTINKALEAEPDLQNLYDTDGQL